MTPLLPLLSSGIFYSTTPRSYKIFKLHSSGDKKHIESIVYFQHFLPCPQYSALNKGNSGYARNF